ncbi:C40 family peptidase [Kitasatospora sp. NPDC059648]|uniref:C40 family peptidase n=1 Tax=Kitasatospora sp. NPDC059648 TaxID=3346894 RepID=UPI00369D77A6
MKAKGFALAAAGLMAVPLILIVGGSGHAQSGKYCSVSVSVGDQGGGTPGPVTAAGVQLDAEQTGNAQTIARVAREKGLPTRAAAIALMTAMQESSLRRLPPTAGHDAAGLFQQRSVVGWGTPEQVLDPIYSANAFYFGVPSQHIPGLTSVVGWERMDMADAAETVQVSGVGYQYRKWADFGTALAQSLSGGDTNKAVTCTDATPAALAGPAVNNVINRAMSQLGVPYVWGGGEPTGPTTGFCGDNTGWLNGSCFASSHAGFDCSSLVQYAWWPYVHLPRVTTQQYEAGQHIPIGATLPGDLVFWQSGPEGIYHVAMVLVNDAGKIQIVEAPRTGLSVRVRDLPLTESHLMSTAVRLSAPDVPGTVPGGGGAGGTPTAAKAP